MAYDGRPGFMNRSPVIDQEHRPSPWVQHDHHYALHRHSSSYHSLPISNLMDPESEDSDVSVTDGEYNSNFSFPISLPAAPSINVLENQETIATHLKKLADVDSHNSAKQKRLSEKRARKDARIARKRVAQDETIKAIMEARARHDSRIKQRRERENYAFKRLYEDLDEEERRLQERLKRLRRGHLVEDGAANSSISSSASNRRISMTAGSPSTPSYSTIPPPAKRHQTSHPTHADNIPPYHAPPPAHTPSYQFHPPPTQHASTPYHPGPHYHSPNYGPSPTVPSHSRVPSNTNERPSSSANGKVRSPHGTTPSSAPASAPAPAPAPASMPKTTSAPLPSYPPTASTPLPPRQSNATYDTRPPPSAPHSSSFAAVNHPHNPGFAAVNSAPPAIPATANSPSVKEEPLKTHSRAVDRTPARTNSAEEKSHGSSSAANKRTPSTTHPYQMSEAFANRHHHCERTDSLNRGIWTWFGPHSSKEHPTAPATEMYLVCNHDGCRRIDWRTVHGLQCHIVKNHEQPKGTIGSLEKALAAYGVPVSEIEEYERQHGPGSGGTMADPKNAKARTKPRDLVDRRDTGERESSASAAGPSQLQHRTSHGSNSPHLSYVPVGPPTSHIGRKRSHSFDEHAPESGSESTPVDLQKLPPARAVSGFQAVNATWMGINSTPSKRPQAREWSSNQVNASEKAHSPHLSHVPPATAAPAPFWSSWAAKNEPTSESPVQITSIVPSQRQIPMQAPTAPAASSPSRPVEQPPQVASSEATPTKELTQRNEGHDRTTEVAVITTREPPATARLSEPKTEAEDAPMVDVLENPAHEPARRSPSIPAVAKAADISDVHQDEVSIEKEPSPQQEDSADGAPRALSSEEAGNTVPEETKDVRSPEASHKRSGPPRRESRRSSMAAASSAKASVERSREDDTETNYTANTASKAESIEDDSDSITVTLVPNTDRQRDRDAERTKTPVRLPNGRFSRTSRRR